MRHAMAVQALPAPEAAGVAGLRSVFVVGDPDQASPVSCVGATPCIVRSEPQPSFLPAVAVLSAFLMLCT